MLTILIAGDFCSRGRVEKLINEGKYEDIFGQTKQITAKANYSVVNLEAPVVLGQAKPITKTGPNLKCTKKSIEAIRYAGFDMVTLANNHIGDYGDTGIYDTFQSLDEAKLDFVGAGENLKKACAILYKSIKNKTFAFVNFCENEWTIATNTAAGANPMNIVSNYRQIQEAKRNADYVIVIIHGGHENYQLPSLRMKETYRFFIDIGANVVINHHQHCFSGYESYNDGLIFYGLGNFCFDHAHNRNSIWNEGYMVQLLFEQNNLSFDLYPYKQCHETPCVQFLNKKEKHFFEEKIKELNNIILDDYKLQLSFDRFCRSMEKFLTAPLEYNNRYLRWLFLKGFLPFPSHITKRTKLLLKNSIRCESHRDTLISTL
jgi:poly-gamma-glutamate synthesis protein (capsule biosynthesis protein)